MRQKPFRPFIAFAFPLLSILALLIIFPFLNACREETHHDSFREEKEPVLIRCNEFLIPLFDTPTEQFDYAVSLFQDRQRQKAALTILINHFPEAKTIKGEAELELAYMMLGNDFRLAEEKDCRRAITRYQRILSEYADIPSICAKALWNIAWIHTDLLHEKEQGMTSYWRVVKKYPQETFSRVSPVPWIRLIFRKPLHAAHPAVHDRKIRWASLSLLEIVRNSDRAAEKRAAFETLYENYRTSPSYGYALLEMLASGQSCNHFEGLVQEYIQNNTANCRLNADLQLALDNRRSRLQEK
jgi:hypothetical protein